MAEHYRMTSEYLMLPRRSLRRACVERSVRRGWPGLPCDSCPLRQPCGRSANDRD